MLDQKTSVAVRCLALCLATTALPTAAKAQPSGPPSNREAMWYAPTAEDWAKPCLIQWQRTFADAVGVAKKTGKPILICVNMDGEIASEHYAGVRYRQPKIARLYQPYVTVIASVYRHNPRDYDEAGRRIICPRFGSVTCGEHIAIEPELHEKYMEGRRIAPRHIMVELDGEETYDVYYAFDTESVFEAVRNGITDRDAPPPTFVRGDRSITERVDSRDSADQTAVEQAYLGGDREMREQLLNAAQEQGDAAPMDLLRLAVFGLDVELSRSAREILAQATDPRATDLIADALSVPMAAEERQALIRALERIGKQSPRAKTLAVVQKGLGNESATVDMDAWAAGLAAGDGQGTAVDAYELQSRLDSQNAILTEQDASAHLDLAEAFLTRAFAAQSEEDVAGSNTDFVRLLFLDARRTALEAEQLGARDWRVDAVLALSSYYLHDNEEAHARAERAVEKLPSGDDSWNGMAVLELFAKLRCQAIAKAQANNESWPPEWLTDVNSACSILARHPFGTAAQVAWHYDILQWLKAPKQAARVLDHGLVRFSDSPKLHQRLRGRILRDKGVEGLEQTYAALLAEEGACSDLVWFAGYANLIAAEFHRRRGHEEEALLAYQRAMDHYERGIAANPKRREIGDHWLAMAHAGRARVAFETGADETALTELLASFARSPESANTLDGLSLSAVDTAKMLLARFEANGDSEHAKRLQAGLDSLHPSRLGLPAYEFEQPADNADGR